MYKRQEEILGRISREERIEELLSVLTPKEREVIRLRFGLDGKEGRTLREIGEIFNLTRERIRQIETEALRKLRERWNPPKKVGKLDRIGDKRYNPL